MHRQDFIKLITLATTGFSLYPYSSFSKDPKFPVIRVPKSQRRFTSEAIEKAIEKFKDGVKDRELSWLFENCFPNTLDTTVFTRMKDNEPDTYIITGDIDAMWLRDSTAQVWPYLQFIPSDQSLQKLVHGLINRQVKCILKDPYANAFYDDESKKGEWKDDLTEMKPGIHERKWEIDSLCYPIRLAYRYWKITKDASPFGEAWKKSIQSTLKVFKEQQRRNGPGSYSFQRTTSWATDGVPLAGYGYPVKPVGLICSMFRPSDDATIFPFLIPANFFAMVSLKQSAEMVTKIFNDIILSSELEALALEVDTALKKYGIIDHADFGKIYAYEVNGYGSFNLMDDANVPSLLSLPYLDAVPPNDAVYLNTRKLLLSANNPFYFSGKAGEGIGGPHAGIDMIWPLSIIIRGLTSQDETEIAHCITLLKNSHGGTGFMHESFHKDDAQKFTRKWFAWANTIFGEFLWNVYINKPHLLK
jgi:uncharacterized protein